MQYEDHRPRVAAQRREQMRMRLLEGALALGSRNGLAAISIDSLVAEAQVSRGTFYKYFDSTIALIDALAKEIADEVMLLIDPIVLTSEDPATRVATGVRLALRFARQNPMVGAFLTRLGWPCIPHDHLMLVFLPRDLLQGMQQKKFAQMDMAAALNLTLGVVIGGLHTVVGDNAPEDFPEQAAMTVLLGLGVERKTAVRIATSTIPGLEITGNGLLARTL